LIYCEHTKFELSSDLGALTQFSSKISSLELSRIAIIGRGPLDP